MDATPSPSASPAFARVSLLRRLIGRALALNHRLVGKRRYDDFRVEHVCGGRFIVIPSVFNPKVPRSGEFLASVIGPNLIDERAEVLDMGTGSGVCAILAARHTRHVVAVDINATAIRCARINALLNHVERSIEFRQGDLFAPVTGDRFDLILFNPPFLKGAPRDDRDRAWRSTDVAERFAAGLCTHLKPRGRCLVVLSSFANADMFLDEFRKYLKVSAIAERHYVNERLVIFGLTPLSCQRDG